MNIPYRRNRTRIYSFENKMAQGRIEPDAPDHLGNALPLNHDSAIEEKDPYTDLYIRGCHFLREEGVTRRIWQLSEI